MNLDYTAAMVVIVCMCCARHASLLGRATMASIELVTASSCARLKMCMLERAYQLRHMLPKLDVNAAIGKAQALQLEGGARVARFQLIFMLFAIQSPQ